ncbi:MAG: type II secretion system protein [Patescibacteria group bacterium]
MAKQSNKQGFTLLELLVVIGIIGILAAIVIVAINPGRQFAQARNAQRWNDVNALLNAIHQYAVDNNGSIPAGINATYQVFGTAGVDGNNPNACGAVVAEADTLDLTANLVPTYITGLPYDPSTGTDGHTDYYVAQDAGTGRVTVATCDPELGVTISVTR